MEGIMYLLDQAGRGLAQANAEIARLQARVAELEAARDATTEEGPS